MNILDASNIFVRYRRMIIGMVASIIGVTVIVCQILPERYTSSFVIFPNLAGSFAQTSHGIGAIAGSRLSRFGSSNIMLSKVIWNPEFISQVAQKRFLIWGRNGLTQISLADMIGDRDTSNLLMKANKYIHADVDKLNGCLNVEVETPYPELSFYVTSFILEKLKKHINARKHELRQLNNSYYSSRIREAKTALAYCEQDLSMFLSKNRGWVESDHPEEKLELERLKRKQNIYVGVYLNLMKKAEMEDNKVSEMNPSLTVIDDPEIPSIKSYPKKKVIFAQGLILSIVLSLFAVITRYQVEALRLHESS